MDKFRFRLQALVRLRTAERDQRRLQLAEALQARQLLLQQANLLEQELATLRQQIRIATQPGRVDVDGMLGRHRYELLLSSRASQLSQQTDTLEEEIERRRQALVDADQQVKLLDKLHHKQWQEHQRLVLAAEARRLDEIGQRSHRTTQAES